ncbi:hypothetical protein [uncultured Nostoc sp.]|uniref:hypothetical protein n=1 Tax=uncultured Nostoc sp. TaxID=340711 RepID=UPI0035CAC83D
MQNRPSPTSKGTDLKLVQARERFVELTSYYSRIQVFEPHLSQGHSNAVPLPPGLFT